MVAAGVRLPPGAQAISRPGGTMADDYTPRHASAAPADGIPVGHYHGAGFHAHAGGEQPHEHPPAPPGWEPPGAAPAPRPPWRKRHRVLFTLGCIAGGFIVLTFIAGVISGGHSSQAARTAAGQPAHSATPPQSAHRAPAQSAAHRPAHSTATAPTIGQPVRDGVYTFTVRKFECGLRGMQEPPIGGVPGNSATPANGQFCVAVVDELNDSNSPQEPPFDASMVGTNGKSYAIDDDPMTLSVAQARFLPSQSVPPSQVNPGATNHDVFVWDVPAGVQGASVTLHAPFSDTSGAVVSVG
jgi:hypothetical protein